MKFYSTRDKSYKTSLKQAAFMGLTPDGGLFMPERIPSVDMKMVNDLADKSFADMALYLAKQFFGDDLSDALLKKAVEEAFFFPVPLNNIGDNLYTLELFHGSTFAFKDFGAGFMGRMLGLLNDSAEELVILTATSGDTGSAVANGFYNIPGIKVVVLYPEGKISNLQESQMTTLGGNIYPLRVNGTFDDCQRLVKMVFSDKEYRAHKNVTSANSINLLRWIPQSFYYFYGAHLWCKATGGEAPDIVVPSGNYGNISAGMLAHRMGLPVRRFIAASNANNIIPKFLETGKYEPKASVRTIANAMDVGAPSNYERIMDLYGTLDSLKAETLGYWCDDNAIKKAISDVYKKYNYLIDPHSAVGYNAACHYNIDGFWLSTAHHAKFGEVTSKELGFMPELPAGLSKFLNKEKRSTPMEVDVNALKNFVDKI